jgi:micrococcal nuclease
MSKRRNRIISVSIIIITILVLEALGVPINTKTINFFDEILVLNDSPIEAPQSGVYMRVVRAVDGDTIKISLNDKDETVRLIGINTPESVDPRVDVECFGKEASDKMKELVSGRDVRIEYDPTQQVRDKYNRILAYVYLDDGTFINQKMVEDGYAFEYTYNVPYMYQKEFKALEYSARSNEAGLWNKSVCNYSENSKKGVSKNGVYK